MKTLTLTVLFIFKNEYQSPKAAQKLGLLGGTNIFSLRRFNDDS
jgi:hypothetical protein